MRRTNKQKLAISLFVLLLLVIGIVYATLTSNLSINGGTKLAGNTWDIHFANLNVTNGSVEATTPASINPTDSTKISYSIELSKPGDYYEFTVDVVNAGTIPGKVSISSLSGIDSSLEDIVDYTITYTNGRPIQVNDILNSNSSKNITVRVYYKEDISNSELITDDIDLDLTYTLEYVQSDHEEVTTDSLIQQLKTENTSCFTKYTGQVTDQVGETVTASNVYFNKCADKRNIIFNNMCWQMIRTTETGGIKMVYNGDVVDNKCLNTRGDHKGIVGANGSTQTLNASYLYGDSFTYDITNSTFTLTDTITSTWSDSTYENLIGKFTCKNTEGTCTTLYNINGYSSNTTAYTSSYTIGDTNYAQIGTSTFNANYRSPANVGYMFNKVYNYKEKYPETNTYKYGSTFTYDTSTNTYTLSGTTQDISTWSSGYKTINNTHYTCWNQEGTCANISYVYYTNSFYAHYIEISDGNRVEDVLNEMLSSNDVNRYNSSIKGIIDSWYRQNLNSKTNMLEDTVYCNARNIRNYGGWNPEGGSTTSNYYLQFKNSSLNNDISCANETDQFAVSNNKAKLTYPVGLATHEELYTLTNNNSSTYYGVLTKTGVWWWGLSPTYFYYQVYVRCVGIGGFVDTGNEIYNAGGVRFVVSLASGAVISEGNGSEESPWIVQE